MEVEVVKDKNCCRIFFPLLISSQSPGWQCVFGFPEQFQLPQQFQCPNLLFPGLLRQIHCGLCWFWCVLLLLSYKYNGTGSVIMWEWREHIPTSPTLIPEILLGFSELIVLNTRWKWKTLGWNQVVVPQCNKKTGSWHLASAELKSNHSLARPREDKILKGVSLGFLVHFFVCGFGFCIFFFFGGWGFCSFCYCSCWVVFCFLLLLFWFFTVVGKEHFYFLCSYWKSETFERTWWGTLLTSLKQWRQIKFWAPQSLTAAAI